MEQYISKSALITELEKRIKVSQDYAKCNLTEKTRIGNHAQQLELNDILAFLDTLDTKEVDLDMEVALWANAIPEIQLDDVKRLAKYFYELGLKAKGE